MPDGRINVEPPRVIETLAADDEVAVKTLTVQMTEVWASTHGPPPELAHLRTVILLA